MSHARCGIYESRNYFKFVAQKVQRYVFPQQGENGLCECYRLCEETYRPGASPISAISPK